MPGGSKKGGGLKVGSAYKMKNSALHMGAKYGSPIQANYASPHKKALVGDQNNLPEELKAKIEAAPGKYASPAKADETITSKKLPTVNVSGGKKTKHKDVTSKGGFNEKIRKQVKEGNTKVMETPQGNRYTVTSRSKENRKNKK